MKFAWLCMAVICLMQYGCGEDLCQKSDLHYGGLCIQKGFNIAKDEVETLVAVTEAEVQRYYPEVVDIKNKFKDEQIRVEFIDGLLAMDCDNYEKDVYVCEHYIGGVNYNAHHIYVEYDECLGATALAHELLHSIDDFYLDAVYDNNEENDHDRPWFFTNYLDTIGEDRSLEIIDVRIGINLLCTLNSCAEWRQGYLCQNLWPRLTGK